MTTKRELSDMVSDLCDRLYDRLCLEHQRHLVYTQHVTYLEQSLAKARDALTISEMIREIYNEEDNNDY